MADGKKWDGGKPPMLQGLIQYFPRALAMVAAQSKYGKEKYDLTYDDRNWAKVDDGENRYGDALVRHIVGEYVDGPVDPESGDAQVLHRAAAAWCALARLELYLAREAEPANENKVEWVKLWTTMSPGSKAAQVKRGYSCFGFLDEGESGGAAAFWVKRSDCTREGEEAQFFKPNAEIRWEDPCR